MSESVIYFGVTRGDNWWCHPMFSWKKLTTFFSHHPLESDDLLAVVSSPLPSSHVLYPVFFLNSATKIILFGCHPRMASERSATAFTVMKLQWDIGLQCITFNPAMSSMFRQPLGHHHTSAITSNQGYLHVIYALHRTCYYRNPPPGHISPTALFAALHLSGTLWTVTL